jgi:hypothetical protein
MSKRYGRNQKRQAKSDLQNMERRSVRAEESLKLTKWHVRSLEDQLHGVSQILDKHFMGFDPVEIRTGRIDSIRIEKLQSIGAPIIGQASPIEMMPYYAHELHCMTTEVLDDAFGDSIHVRVRHQETGQLGYAITKRAMKEMPKEVFIRTVSREMAMQLRHELDAQT